MSTSATAPSASPIKTVAAIDIGATLIHLEIAEINAEGAIRKLDSLRRGTRLGRDTFTRGRIEQETIEECVEILRGFRRVMEEYGITSSDQVRAVATSAIREAQNGDTFLDRIYMATRINVRAIDEPEETRLIYLAAQTVFEADPSLQQGTVLVADVGGGTTQLLMLKDGQIHAADSYRLGTVRMRETLETHRAPTERVRTVLGQHIRRFVEQAVRSLPVNGPPLLFAMSGEAQFAASQLDPNWPSARWATLDYKSLAAFTDKLLPLTAARLVGRYQLTFQEAETIGPALLVYLHLARAFKADRILVPKATFRDGLFKELTLHGYWTGPFADQVRASAEALAAKYHVDTAHAHHVADLAVRIFRALENEHHLDRRFELLLEIAARLHEVGSFISSRSHHKHSLYIIQHSDLFGLTREDIAIVALIARYHRRAHPARTHPDFMALSREDRLTVSKLAAILRVADALDRNHLQQIKDVSFLREPGRFVIAVRDVEDLTLERLALKEKGELFREVFGMPVELREQRTAGLEESHAP